MENILLEMLTAQKSIGNDLEVALEFDDGDSIVGVLTAVDDGVVSIHRRIARRTREIEYADSPRHYRLSAIRAAYYTEES